MGVRQRAHGVYHYVFDVRGKTYTGSCGTTNHLLASNFEARLRAKITAARSEAAAVEMHRDLLVSQSPATIANLQPATERQARELKSFLIWTKDTHPGLQAVSEVNIWLAQQYTDYLLRVGRPDPRDLTAASAVPLKPATARACIAGLAAVFRPALEERGIALNPWTRVRFPRHKAVPRQEFTAGQLRQIVNAPDEACPLWVKHLVVVGSCTGLREGDICCLTWNEVDLESRMINLTSRKTKARLAIPMIPALHKWLTDWRTSNHGQWVSADLASRYQGTGRSQIGHDFGRHLRRLGIETRDDRGNTVLDVHSLRHTFCYLAAISGVPLPIVQSIVGHTSPAMTARYTAHASLEARRELLQRLPPLFAAEPQVDVIGLLETMDASNWQSVRDAAVSLLRHSQHLLAT